MLSVLSVGWCGPPGRCVLACGRRVVETSNNDLRYRLKAGGGGRGRVYSGGRDQGYGGGRDRSYGGGVFAAKKAVEDAAKKAVEDAVKQAGGDIRPRQKPRWAKEKEKREKAEAKLEEVTADKEKAKEEISQTTFTNSIFLELGEGNFLRFWERISCPLSFAL